MKRTLYTLAATALMVSLFACNEQYITYEDRNYVMFTEAEQERLVLQDQDYFTIQVGATNASTKDRTFGVEIVDVADYPDLNLDEIPTIDEFYAGLYAYDEDETEELLIFLQNVLESEKDEKQKKKAVDGGTDGSSAH